MKFNSLPLRHWPSSLNRTGEKSVEPNNNNYYVKLLQILGFAFNPSLPCLRHHLFAFIPPSHSNVDDLVLEWSTEVEEAEEAHLIANTFVGYL